MALIVSSILSTSPCLTPSELARPEPRISTLPNSFLRPAIAAIFVVPISSPTTLGCCSCCILILFLVVVYGVLIVNGHSFHILHFLSNFIIYYSTFIIQYSLTLLLHPNHLPCVSYIQLLVRIHSRFAQHLLIEQQQPFKF